MLYRYCDDGDDESSPVCSSGLYRTLPVTTSGHSLYTHTHTSLTTITMYVCVCCVNNAGGGAAGEFPKGLYVSFIPT